MSKQEKRNKIFFGLGTIGRDMFYALEANAMVYFLMSIMHLDNATYGMVTFVLTILRIFDAFNDPITGMLVDNIKSPWGKFKPAMLFGAVTGIIFYLVMFADFGLTGVKYVIVFGAAYILWDITYGINDIAYWSMMPSLSLDQKSRESIGAFARICANIGMYIIMVGYPSFVSMLGGDQKAFFTLAAIICVLMFGFQLFTLIGVKENKEQFKQEEKTSLKQMFKVLVENDQLMWTTLSMALFMIGYCATTGFALYYMKYLFGDENMYLVLAAACGVAQLGALLVFPKVAKLCSRKKLYTIATIMVTVGYLLFMFAEHSLVLIAVSAIIIFIGQAFIQTLMLMFLSDTIEYGQWKLGKRNDSITFSIQPLINKIGGALATGICSLTYVLSGVKNAEDLGLTSIDSNGVAIFKVSMFIIPLILIIIGYFIYMKKYTIDEEKYSEIVKDLEARGDIKA
ncbi:MAG: glycoside-pentoside-hexuronide (GPH):cation symporter [Erysipelotrichaceae bacterium]|nr:glycoside-pentoside-hexuronide (GPH):cation symporter [Erysipelotrichaceae bacterium]